MGTGAGRRGAGLAAVLVGLSAVACSGDDDGEGSAASKAESRPWVEAVTDAQEVIVALSDERAASLLELTGMTGVVELSPASLADARSTTDEVLAELGPASGEAPSPAAPTAETASLLEAARAEVDRAASESGLTNTEASGAAFDDYARLAGGYRDGVDAAVLQVDDPDLRTALELVLDTGRLDDLSAELVMQLITGAIDPAGPTREQVTGISRTWSLLDTLAADVRATTLEPYAAAVGTGFPSDYHDALAEHVQGFADGQPTDINALLADQPKQVDDPSYLTLHFDLHALLTTQHA